MNNFNTTKVYEQTIFEFSFTNSISCFFLLKPDNGHKVLGLSCIEKI